MLVEHDPEGHLEEKHYVGKCSRWQCRFCLMVNQTKLNLSKEKSIAWVREALVSAIAKFARDKTEYLERKVKMLEAVLSLLRVEAITHCWQCGTSRWWVTG